MSIKRRWSKEDLREFEVLIKDKLKTARKKLETLQPDKNNENLYSASIKGIGDSAEFKQRENLNQLAIHQYKFIKSLEAALERIKAGTYGVCAVTHELISKERLREVPHTTLSLAAKLQMGKN